MSEFKYAVRTMIQHVFTLQEACPSVSAPLLYKVQWHITTSLFYAILETLPSAQDGIVKQTQLISVPKDHRTDW